MTIEYERNKWILLNNIHHSEDYIVVGISVNENNFMITYIFMDGNFTLGWMMHFICVIVLFKVMPKWHPINRESLFASMHRLHCRNTGVWYHIFFMEIRHVKATLIFCKLKLKFMYYTNKVFVFKPTHLTAIKLYYSLSTF